MAASERAPSTSAPADLAEKSESGGCCLTDFAGDWRNLIMDKQASLHGHSSQIQTKHNADELLNSEGETLTRGQSIAPRLA